MSKSSAELFKASDDVATFLRQLRGLLEVGEILRDHASLLQAADEATRAHADAIAQRDAMLAEMSIAKASLEAVKAQAHAIAEKAKAAAAGVMEKAETAARETMDRAKEAERKMLADAADKVGAAQAMFEDAADARLNAMREVDTLEQRKRVLTDELAAIRAKLM
jgi:hypothetical protein